MNRKRDIAIATAAILIVCLFMAITSGCKESQQQPVWGKGDLPPHWTEYFGSDNGARLDYKQSQMLDEIARRVITLEINQYIPDPNGGR